jgi:hypothetical protein
MHVLAVTISAAVATGVFVVLLGASIALWAVLSGGRFSESDVLVLGAFGLVLIPLALPAFAIGATIVGPASFLTLRRLRLDTDASAILVAGVSSGMTAHVQFGAGPGDVPNLIFPLALAGGAAGLAYRRTVLHKLRPPPAPPA